MKKIIIAVITILVIGAGAYYVLAGRTTCQNTINTSPQAPAHTHRWCSDQAFTEDFCNAQGQCHKHSINRAQNIAEPAGAGPHTHRLE